MPKKSEGSENFFYLLYNKMNRSLEEILLGMWELDYIDRIDDYCEDCASEARKDYLKSLKRPIKVDYFFITVNPIPNVDLQIFLKLLANFCRRKPVIDYVYNIEQRGETEADIGKGIHSHLLITWNAAMSGKVRQYLGETFKRVIGSNTNNIININKIPKEYVLDKMDYLEGNKWDSEKESKIAIDKIFREQNKISLLYKKDGTL